MKYKGLGKERIITKQETNKMEDTIERSSGQVPLDTIVRYTVMCNCHSYNADIGTKPEVILDPNEYFDWDSEARTVCVDACIAEQIKALWNAGIWTKGCCCGHNGKFGNPNVILDTTEKPKKAIKLLKKIDPNRDWDVLQWQLTKCT